MTNKEQQSIDKVYLLLSNIREENNEFKKQVSLQISKIEKNNVPLSLEHDVIGTVQQSISKAISTSLSDYNSPLKKYVNETVALHEKPIRELFNNAISEGLKSEEFKVECKTYLLSKIAKTVISGLDGSVTKVVNGMKQDSVFRSKLTLVINDLVSEYVNK